MTENRMTPKRFTVVSVKKRDLNDIYLVRYYDENWKLQSIEVQANDDIDAIFIGTRILRAKQWNHYTNGLAGVILLCFFAGVGLIGSLIFFIQWVFS